MFGSEYRTRYIFILLFLVEHCPRRYFLELIILVKSQGVYYYLIKLIKVFKTVTVPNNPFQCLYLKINDSCRLRHRPILQTLRQTRPFYIQAFIPYCCRGHILAHTVKDSVSVFCFVFCFERTPRKYVIENVTNSTAIFIK